MSKHISDLDSLLSTVTTKATEDEMFRNKLINDPLEVLNSVSDSAVVIAKGKRIEIVDQTNKDVIYINIPSNNTSEEDIELTDAQLELVSGGGGFPIILR